MYSAGHCPGRPASCTSDARREQNSVAGTLDSFCKVEWSTVKILSLFQPLLSELWSKLERKLGWAGFSLVRLTPKSTNEIDSNVNTGFCRASGSALHTGRFEEAALNQLTKECPAGCRIVRGSVGDVLYRLLRWPLHQAALGRVGRGGPLPL